MSKNRNLADLLDASGDVKSGSLDNVTIADNAVTMAKIADADIVTLKSGRKNLIINGDQRIDQRNGGSAVTVNSGFSNFYAVDRFKGLGQSSDGVYTLQQVSDAPDDFTNSLKATVTTADASIGAPQQYYIGQFVEGYNVSNLAYGSPSAKSITLSFWVKSSLTGSFGGTVTNQSANRHWVYSYTIDSANTWEYKQVVISGDTASAISATNGIGLRVNWSLGVGTLRQKTVGSWQTDGYYYPYSFSGAVDVIATNGATFYLTGVQLELGSVATDFEHRSYGEELALCQRYYEELDLFGTVTNKVPWYNEHQARVYYKVRKRVTPSLNTPFCGNFQPGGGTGTTTISKQTVDSVTVISNSSTGGSWSDQFYNSSTFLTIDAEL